MATHNEKQDIYPRVLPAGIEVIAVPLHVYLHGLPLEQGVATDAAVGLAVSMVSAGLGLGRGGWAGHLVKVVELWGKKGHHSALLVRD